VIRVWAAAFYISIIAVAPCLLLLSQFTWLRGIPGVAMIGRTLLLLAVLLPVADYLFARSQRSEKATAPKPAAPVYSFSAAKGDPTAFRAWWAYYTKEWLRDGGGAAAITMPDPKGVHPFVQKPNSTTSFFDNAIRINNFGFRGADIERDKGKRYRIFALGESPTFGSTIKASDKPWPEVLGDTIRSRLRCDRPIEVINAGIGGYDLKGNLERVKRDIIPLQPDLVLSYHGFNGARFVETGTKDDEPQSAPERADGPSALINEAVYRYKLWRWRKAPAVSQASFSDEKIMESPYASLYRELIELGREHKFQVVLSTFSMAITPSSPTEVIEFYSKAFGGGDGFAARMAAHNRIVEKIAEQKHIPLIDTRPSLDGKWDDDLFLDPIHFTQKGADAIAEEMFVGLLPILRGDGNLRCTEQ
jgi:lysophospholipase L1-like esterase